MGLIDYLTTHNITQAQAAGRFGVSLKTIQRRLHDGLIIDGVLYAPVKSRQP
jgi:predicted DNA-binding protein (UPF0251 family)